MIYDTHLCNTLSLCYHYHSTSSSLSSLSSSSFSSSFPPPVHFHLYLLSEPYLYPTSFPGYFIPPPQRERGKKDPGSGWSRISVTNLSLSEGSQFIRVMSPLLSVTNKTGSLGNHGKLSFDFAVNSYHIYYIAFNI